MRLMLIVFLVLINLSEFILFGVDKHRAKVGAWRISERRLLLITLLGGCFGAAFGMCLFHHKVRKLKFRVVVPLCVVIWIVLLVLGFTGEISILWRRLW